jgi:PEGA domain-containing protein
MEDHMLKRYAVISLVVVALITIPLLARAQSERAPLPLVHVAINSRPEIAEVRIDGAFVGTTPLPYRLTPGVHKIEMTRHAFQNWSRELTVTAENGTSVTALMDESDAKPCPK